MIGGGEEERIRRRKSSGSKSCLTKLVRKSSRTSFHCLYSPLSHRVYTYHNSFVLSSADDYNPAAEAKAERKQRVSKNEGQRLANLARAERSERKSEVEKTLLRTKGSTASMGKCVPSMLLSSLFPFQFPWTYDFLLHGYSLWCS